MWWLMLSGCFGGWGGEVWWDSGVWGESRPPIAEIRLEPWVSCDALPGSGDGGAECARAALPVDHNFPSGRVLIGSVKRIKPPGASNGQLWVITGGPGASAVDDMAQLPVTALALEQGLTVYAVDHRGVGGTGRLSCGETLPADAAAWGRCGASIREEWGSAFDHLTITQSARDLVALTATLAEGEDLWLYGVSYGSWVVERYIDHFPERNVAVILEAPVPRNTPLSRVDPQTDLTFREVMALCGADAACADRFGGEPQAVVDATLSSLDAGHCAGLGMTASDAGRLFAHMLQRAETRDLVPAAAHRLQRCDVLDVERLKHLDGQVPRALGQLPITDGNTGAGDSVVALHHFAHAELWRSEASPLVSPGLNEQLAVSAQSWPAYLPAGNDEWVYWYEDIPQPQMLILHGGLDPLTAGDGGWSGDFEGRYALIYELETGAHDLIGGTPFENGTRDCGSELTTDFLASRAVLTSTEACAWNLDPPNFSGDAAVSARYFGAPDAWDNED
ncbi:MAG: hypothetical protein AAFV53_16205 [Myxococcota bacterium]